jgi:hypothetical protein
MGSIVVPTLPTQNLSLPSTHLASVHELLQPMSDCLEEIWFARDRLEGPDGAAMLERVAKHELLLGFMLGRLSAVYSGGVHRAFPAPTVAALARKPPQRHTVVGWLADIDLFTRRALAILQDKSRPVEGARDDLEVAAQAVRKLLRAYRDLIVPAAPVVIDRYHRQRLRIPPPGIEPGMSPRTLRRRKTEAKRLRQSRSELHAY